MQASGSRRQVVLGALASLAVPLGARAQPLTPAQPFSPADMLGKGLLGPLQALLPADAFQAAQFVAEVIALEREAKAAGLPGSKLTPHGTPLLTDIDRLYELALPRLVALIDRAEQRDPALADKGGALLAKLHATQHVIPQWLNSMGLDAAGQTSTGLLGIPGFGTGPTAPLQLDPGSDDGADVAIQRATDLPPLALPDPDIAVVVTPATINRSLRFGDLAEEYAALFKAADLRPQHSESATWHLTMMRQSRARYERVAQRSGVPWYVIAAIHGLEASFNFRAHFHNGDFPLTSRTRQVPAGRPLTWLPPSDWESSALDALRLLGFAGASDWSLPRTLYRLEAYNGFGYRRIGRATPYLWCFSSVYDRGKFVSDGRYDARARSQQCGAAVMVKLLADAGDIAFA